MKERALELLKQAVGRDAEFREDQWEAIESVMKGQRTLVVEKTGWGKSIVYFIATKLLRERGKGITILISPLLSLMRNQIEAAEKIGLVALSVNSSNQEEWGKLESEIVNGYCDLLIISPERLGNEEFRNNIITSIMGNIGMFVVDEAHCISDWGHDFRPDYRRIVRIVSNLPKNVPLLATTATANNRVVNDIKEQLGHELNIIRGPLTRKSLKIQVIKLKDQSERLAWLYENINRLPGSGIIYCLTKNDCNKVARWLRSKGINALEYHTSLSDDSKEKKELEVKRENMLMNNEVKALVSTIKIGMGYDKPDLGFVIHFQRPGSLVSYYQQIGRAGRKLDTAYAILLNGKEDDEIQEYFIESSFPSQEEMEKVLNVVESSDNGINKNELYKRLNMKNSRIDNCLKMLEVDMAIIRNGYKYFRTTNLWIPDHERSRRVTKQRYDELDGIKEFVDTKSCYMEFISEKLDDLNKKKCGRCSNCKGEDFLSDSLNHNNIIEAINFLKGEFLILKPRKQWPAGIIDEKRKNISKEYQNEQGRILCNYGDAGWGKFVKEDKYHNGYFREELVDATVNLIKNNWVKENEPTWVTSIPSLRRPELVKNFAMRVANKLNIPYREVITKTIETEEQKKMQNSYQQANNIYNVFYVSDVLKDEAVLLIDDVVDSRWTLTVCGSMLKEKGSGEVYPYAIASTAEGGLD